MGTMDRLDFKTRRESATKRVYKGLYIVGRPLRRRTKQQSIKTKLEDPYGGFLQSNQGHQSSQQSEGKRTRGRKGGRRATSPPSPPPAFHEGWKLGISLYLLESEPSRQRTTLPSPSTPVHTLRHLPRHPRPFLQLLFASWCCSALLRNHLGRGLSLKVLDNLSLVHRTLPLSLPPSKSNLFSF